VFFVHLLTAPETSTPRLREDYTGIYIRILRRQGMIKIINHTILLALLCMARLRLSRTGADLTDHRLWT